MTDAFFGVLFALAVIEGQAATPAASGPLRNLPLGWTHQENLCVHSACGSYKEEASGSEVFYSSSESKAASKNACAAPPIPKRFHGEIEGHKYFGFEVTDARASELAVIARESPDRLTHVDDPKVVTDLAPPGASGLVICVASGTLTWRFATHFTDPAQAQRIRALVLEESNVQHLPSRSQPPN